MLASSLTLFLLITARMSGCILFNPLLGRRGIPGLVKGGFILMLSLSAFALTPLPEQVPDTLLTLALAFLLELFLGYVLGLAVNLFFYIPLMAGSVIDMQMGLSMASTYDPASGIQVTATSTLFNVLMSMLFFAANGHHTLIRIFLASGRVVPFGRVALGEDLYAALIEMFNVFAINIELKVIIGLMLTFLFLIPISEFLLEAEIQMLVSLQRILPLMSG